MTKRSKQARGRPGTKTKGRRNSQTHRSWPVVAILAAIGLGIFVLSRGDTDSPPEGAAFTGADLHSMIVDPANPKRIWVGGHEAVSVSEDSGKTWRVVDGLANRDAMGWGMKPDALYVSGHPGLVVSTDGGRSFEVRNQGLPSTDVHAFGAGKAVLYGGAPGVGMFASTDGGASWQVAGGQGRSFFGRILVDPADDRHLVVADAASGVAESDGGGKTFRNLGGVPSPTWVSWDPGNTDFLIASGQAGAARSNDGGKSWQAMDVPPGTSIVEIDPTDPQTIYAASRDGSTVRVMVSRDGGATWKAP